MKKKAKQLLQVRILEVAPNKMFSEGQRQAVRLLHFNQMVECAECGKKSKRHWTALYAFTCLSLELSAGTGKVHPPLTPVCDHPFSPAWR